MSERLPDDEPTIRPATADDGPELAALDARSWPLELQVVPPAGAEAPFFARRAPEDVIVAVVDGRIVGFVHLERHIPIPKNAHVLHLNSLIVDPDFRGRGLAHPLVDAAIAEARRRGVRKLGLRALSTNDRAVALYERHGFVLEGRLKGEFALPDGGYADDLWFALDLTTD